MFGFKKPQAHREIGSAELNALLKDGKALLIDVREAAEFGAGHIPGAVNLPLGSLTELAAAELPDKDALIYLYCRSGARSQTGALQLVRLGYTNLYDLGGIINWPYDIVR